MDDEILLLLRGISARLGTLEQKVKNIEIVNAKPVKRNFSIYQIPYDRKYGIKKLADKNMTSDLIVITKFYVSDMNDPHVRYIGRNTFQYWNDSMWNDDIGGKHTGNIIMRTLKNYYAACNNELLKIKILRGMKIIIKRF